MSIIVPNGEHSRLRNVDLTRFFPLAVFLILKDYNTLSGIAPILEWGYPFQRKKSNEAEKIQKCRTTLKKERVELFLLKGKNVA